MNMEKKKGRRESPEVACIELQDDPQTADTSPSSIRRCCPCCLPLTEGPRHKDTDQEITDPEDTRSTTERDSERCGGICDCFKTISSWILSAPCLLIIVIA